MKEKNKTIEIAIENLDKVNNLSELEQIIKEELTIKLLNAIQEELNRRKKKTKALRRKYKSRGAIEEATEQNHKLDKLNISMENFSNMMNNDIESDAPKYFVRKEETYNQKVKRITHEIVETDYFMDKKTKKVFYSYVESNSSKERLIILYELANTYADYIKEVTNTKEMTKNLQEEQKIKAKTQRYRTETFQSILEQEKEPTEEELLERIELLTNDIYNARETLKHLQELVKIEKEYLSEIRELERTNEVLIDNNEFIEPKNKTEKALQKVLRKIKSSEYVTEYNDSLLRSIPTEIRDLIKKLKKVPDYELEEFVTLSIDIIKNKRKSISKKDGYLKEVEKKFLKKLEHEFENLKQIEYVYEEDTESYYNVLAELLKSDNNYLYMKQLLELEEFQKARTKTTDESYQLDHMIPEKEHIILLVLDQFIYNYKKQLLDQGLEYVDPTYYKKIIKLFQEKEIELSPTEIINYYDQIDQFREYILDKGYHGTNKIMEDIVEVSWRLPKKKEEKKPVEKMTEAERQESYHYILIDQASQNISEKLPKYYSNKHQRIFQIEGIDNYIFSINYKEDASKEVAIHILDTTKIPQEGEIFKEELETGKLKNPILAANTPYPAMTFNYKIDHRNRLRKGNITSSVVAISEKFNGKDLRNYRDNETLKDFICFLHLIQEKHLSNNDIYTSTGIRNEITSYLSDMLSMDFEKYHIPFIYQSNLPNIDEVIEKNHINTCTELSKIDKKKAHKIYNILDKEKLGGKYYTLQYNKTAKINMDPTTELGIYLIDTLKKIQKEKYNPDHAAEQLVPLKDKLNSSIEYVPMCLRVKSDRKLQRMVKEYKKQQEGIETKEKVKK